MVLGGQRPFWPAPLRGAPLLLLAGGENREGARPVASCFLSLSLPSSSRPVLQSISPVEPHKGCPSPKPGTYPARSEATVQCGWYIRALVDLSEEAKSGPGASRQTGQDNPVEGAPLVWGSTRSRVREAGESKEEMGASFPMFI